MIAETIGLWFVMEKMVILCVYAIIQIMDYPYNAIIQYSV